MIVFKALNGTVPQLCIQAIQRGACFTLGSSSISILTFASTAGRLVEPKLTSKTLFGEQLFAVTWPAMCNSLLAEIGLINCLQIFKSNIVFSIFSREAPVRRFFSRYATIQIDPLASSSSKEQPHGEGPSLRAAAFCTPFPQFPSHYSLPPVRCFHSCNPTF